MSELRQVEEFRQALTHCWLNLCISIPGKRDMMMTPMDFYASITPDCNKFGVSGWSHIGQGAPYCFVFQWKLIQHMVGWFRIIYLEFRRIDHLRTCTLHYFSFCSIFSFVVSCILFYFRPWREFMWLSPSPKWKRVRALFELWDWRIPPKLFFLLLDLIWRFII